MKVHLPKLLVLALGLHTGVALAADANSGKSLHDANCIQCHAKLRGGDPDSIYTRADRRVQDITGLQKQVQRCKTSIGVAWSEQNMKDVVTYLNSTYYKFPATP